MTKPESHKGEVRIDKDTPRWKPTSRLIGPLHNNSELDELRGKAAKARDLFETIITLSVPDAWNDLGAIFEIIREEAVKGMELLEAKDEPWDDGGMDFTREELQERIDRLRGENARLKEYIEKLEADIAKGTVGMKLKMSELPKWKPSFRIGGESCKHGRPAEMRCIDCEEAEDEQ